MDILDQIAEARIQEALRAGELSNLPGAGKPLQLDDDSMIPQELRAAYRILKNSGFLPPEIQLRKEIHEVEQLLLQVEDTAERARALLRLEMLRMRLQTSRRQPTNLHLEEQYYQRLVDCLERNPIQR
ncbi:MAG: DnaJ family domain-containing protein [Candidatus Competibacteraceae bacterium]